VWLLFLVITGMALRAQASVARFIGQAYSGHRGTIISGTIEQPRVVLVKSHSRRFSNDSSKTGLVAPYRGHLGDRVDRHAIPGPPAGDGVR
jgi:hypothetical protein